MSDTRMAVCFTVGPHSAHGHGPARCSGITNWCGSCLKLLRLDTEHYDVPTLAHLTIAELVACPNFAGQPQSDGPVVQRVWDDAPVPLSGLVVGWRDDEVAFVLWDGADWPVEESHDELTPRRRP